MFILPPPTTTTPPAPTAQTALWDLIKTSAAYADHQRKRLVLIGLFAFLHLLALIIWHCVVQAISPGYFNPIGGGVGLVWILLLAIGVYLRAGLPFQLVLVGSLDKNPILYATMRALIGFITIESLVNNFFLITPVSASWGLTLTILCFGVTLLLTRFMRGESINWYQWELFALVNLVLQVVALYYVSVFGSDITPTLPSFWYFLAAVVGVGAIIFRAHHFRYLTFGSAGTLLIIGLLMQAGLMNFLWMHKSVETATQIDLLAQVKKDLDAKHTQIKERLIRKEITPEQATAMINAANLQARQQTRDIKQDPEAVVKTNYYDPTEPDTTILGSRLLPGLLLAVLFVITLGVIFSPKGDSHGHGH